VRKIKADSSHFFTAPLLQIKMRKKKWYSWKIENTSLIPGNFMPFYWYSSFPVCFLLSSVHNDQSQQWRVY